MRSNNDFYVYVIFRPNGVPCYVGKGRGRRAEHHARFSHNRHLKNIYNQSGGILPLVKIRENMTELEACETEKTFISVIGRLSLGTGPLVNLCDGGEGTSGHKRSPESQAKITAAHKGRKHSPEHISRWRESMKGHIVSDETRAKLSAARKGKPRPDLVGKTKGRPAPWVRDRQIGTKNPDHSIRMMGNKNGLGRNLGNQNAIRKLDSTKVAEIKRRIATGERHQSIAESYGIHKSQISSIATGRTWKHVQAN